MIENHHLRKVFLSLSLPVLILEPRGELFYIVDVNEAYLKVTSSSRKDLLGKSNFEAFPKNPNIDEGDFQLLQDSFQQAASEKRKINIKSLRYDIPVRGTGKFEERYWNPENTPVLDPAGKVEFLIHTVRDITKEVLAARKQQENFQERQLLDSFIEENVDALFSLDCEGRFTSANAKLAAAIELPVPELLGKGFEPFCEPKDLAKVRKNFENALTGVDAKFEADFVSAKGKRMILKIALMPNKIGGNVAGVYGIAKDITGLRDREEQIKKNEHKFQALIQEGSDLMAIIDAQGYYLFVSKSSSSVLGLAPETLVGKHVFQFIHPDDQPWVAEQFSKLKEKKQVKISPCRYRTHNDTWIWIETTVTNLLEDPAVQGIVINSRDITTILDQAQEIEHINERYRLAATATEDLVYDWNLATDEVNRYYSGPNKLFGYTPEEVNTRKFWRNHIHPDELEQLRQKLKSTLADPGKTIIQTEYLFRRADGSYAKVIDKGFIIRDNKGAPLRLIGATSDISEIKAKEEALEIANERFRMAMEATNEMIWDWDIETGAITRNQAFEDVYGYSLSSNHPANEFWFSRTLEDDRKRVTESLEQALADKQQTNWKEEYQVRKADNNIAHVIDRAYISRDKNGKATRMVGAVLDVTNSRRLMGEIQKQNELLKQIAWEQSHVVRAPLARLKGLAYLLEIEAFEEMSKEEVIANMNKSADELDQIVKRIVSKAEEINIKPNK